MYNPILCFDTICLDQPRWIVAFAGCPTSLLHANLIVHKKLLASDDKTSIPIFPPGIVRLEMLAAKLEFEKGKVQTPPGGLRALLRPQAPLLSARVTFLSTPRESSERTE